MRKINYQLEYLIGDILSQEGHYVDILSCSEYTLWYLIRQEGIHSFLPALGTKAFFGSGAIDQDTGFDAFSDYNMRIILSNCRYYFHLKPVCLEPGKESLSFIKKAVDEGHFVYTLYDSCYDSMLHSEPLHDYHGHAVTGYDDQKGIYLSLFEGEHEVKYEDMERMATHSKKKWGTYYLKFFFLCREKEEERKVSDQDILHDGRMALSDWKQELNCFENYVEQVKLLSEYPREARMDFVYRQRMIFNSMSEGLHYNFIFKLLLMEQHMGIRSGDLAEEFVSNRKKSVLIANMYRKLYVLLNKNDSFADSYMQKLTQKITEIYINKNAFLLHQYENLLEEECHSL